MLEGKELEKQYDGGAGQFSMDVDASGGVVIVNSYNKGFDDLAKIKSDTHVETNIFKIAEKIAAQTATPWDDKAIAGLKSILGIK